MVMMHAKDDSRAVATNLDFDPELVGRIWKIEQGAGKRSGMFRLIEATSNSVLTTQNDRGGQILFASADSTPQDDQYFSFEMEAVDITRIEYHLERATILSTIPKGIFTQTQSNITDIEQEQVFKISETTSQESTWQTETGFEVGMKVSATFGIPEVADVAVEVNTSYHET